MRHPNRSLSEPSASRVGGVEGLPHFAFAVAVAVAVAVALALPLPCHAPPERCHSERSEEPPYLPLLLPLLLHLHLHLHLPLLCCHSPTQSAAEWRPREPRRRR